MSAHRIVSFLSDFGRADTFVGVCHGVILAGAPDVAIVDLTHDVPPQDVLAGAGLLARAVVHLPVAVHLAVVDPGVGTERAAVAIRASRGDVLIGPDNGLLVPAARRLGGVAGVWSLDDVPEPRLGRSATFHGRDLFAPAAARVARDDRPERLGASRSSWVDLVLPAARPVGAGVVAPVTWIDRFGNVALAAGVDDLAGSGEARSLTVTGGGSTHVAARVDTFGALAADGLGVLVDSDGNLSVVVRGGSAADRLRVGLHDPVRLDPAEGS